MSLRLGLNMKFLIEKQGLERSRLGRLFLNPVSNSNEVSNEVEYKTPLCLLYTNAGNVPHLTHEVLQKVSQDRLPILLTLPSICEMRDSVKGHAKGIGNFVGMGQHFSYLSIQDPGIETKTGYNDSKGISLWKTGGRAQIKPQEFMEMVEIFQPHWFQALCDSDTPSGCSNKRINHSLRRSIDYLDACLKIKTNSSTLKNMGIIGTIQGEFQLKARQLSAQETASRQVDGFAIEGFHINGSKTEALEFSAIQECLDEILGCLPDSKPRIMHGAFHPAFILRAVNSGVDVFDSSYLSYVTERNLALTFNFTMNPEELLKSKVSVPLADSVFKDQMKPLLSNCNCYTCQKYTCAYLNHLIVTSEMLGSVLLMIHNLHHYLEFFKFIRENLTIPCST